jgi:hypothetical protein
MKKMICIMHVIIAGAVCGRAAAMDWGGGQGITAFTAERAQQLVVLFRDAAKDQVRQFAQQTNDENIITITTLRGREPAEDSTLGVSQNMQQAVADDDPLGDCDSITELALMQNGRAATTEQRAAVLDHLRRALADIEDAARTATQQWILSATQIVVAGNDLRATVSRHMIPAKRGIRRWWQIAAQSGVGDGSLGELVSTNPGAGAELGGEAAQWLGAWYRDDAERQIDQERQRIYRMNTTISTATMEARRAACICRALTQGIELMPEREDARRRRDEWMVRTRQRTVGATTTAQRAIALDNLRRALMDIVSIVGMSTRRYELTVTRALQIRGILGELIDRHLRLGEYYNMAATLHNLEPIAAILNEPGQRLVRAIQLLALGHELPNSTLEAIREGQDVAMERIEEYSRQRRAAWD